MLFFNIILSLKIIIKFIKSIIKITFIFLFFKGLKLIIKGVPYLIKIIS
jgi:hypothetical protein